MLPGLRFLFAAIVLATSLLVFGLGAAALLRAAHEQFVSIPARKGPPEPQFAQQPEAPPVLAMVARVDPPSADTVTTDIPTAPLPAASEPAAPTEVPPPVSDPEKLAAVKADDPPVPPAPRPEPQAAEPLVPAQPAEAVPEAAEAAPQASAADASPLPTLAPAVVEAAPAPAEPKVAAMAEPPAAASEPEPAVTTPAVVAPEPTAAPPSPEAIAAESKIATLGGPEVVVEPAASKAAENDKKAAETKKPDHSATGKPAHRKARRRIVRARETRQRLVQQPLDPFGQPTLMPVTRR